MAMPEPPVNWERVRHRIAGMLHVDPATMPDQWQHLCAESVRDAAVDIASILASKGFSGGTIQAADSYPYWVERLAAVIALQRGSALASYPQESLKALDPREMIERIGALLVNGVPVAAGDSDVGGIAYGATKAVAMLSEDPEVRATDARLDPQTGRGDPFR